MVKRIGVGLVALALGLPFTAQATTVSVTTGTQYQVIQGFGACSYWDNSYSSSLANAFWTDESNKALGSQTNGLIGLSILRVGIDDSGSGNWANQAGFATQALGLNPNVEVFGSEWSPPAKWKTNGSVDGSGSGNDNFNPGNSNTVITADLPQYATYQTSFLTAMKSTYGVNVYAISPQNEPDYDPTYDACLWTPAQFDTYVKDLAADIKAANLSTKIMMPESFADNLTGSNTTMADSAAAPDVYIIGMHLYGGGPTALPASYATTAGHPVQSWCTEISEKTSGSSQNTISGAVYYAQLLHKSIVDEGFNAWCYWWLVNVNSDDEGLVTSGGTQTPTMYMMGNYSKFIRPGYMRVSCTENPATNVQVSAYTGTATESGTTVNRIVIVAINGGGSSASQAFSYADQTVSTVYPWITSSSANLAQQSAVTVSGNQFTYTLPANSICTFVADSAVAAVPTATRTSSPQSSATYSPTTVLTATSTRTATPTATSTFTVQASATDTFTAKPSATGTFTALPSATYSPTALPSMSDSPTTEPSVSDSPTTLPTASVPTATPIVATVTPIVPSATSSPTELPTAPPATATATEDPTQEVIQSPITPPVSPEATATPDNTAQPSATPESSATNTVQPSATNTALPSATASGQATATNTPAASATNTPQPTVTSSRTSTPSDTATQRPSATATVTRTPTSLPSATFTATPTQESGNSGKPVKTPTPYGPPLIIQAAPEPNPNPYGILVDFAGPVQGVEGELYTVAMNQLGTYTWGPQIGYWQYLALPQAWLHLPKGVYYLRLMALHNGVGTGSVVVKMAVTR
jgi:glucuronoarabinoxylan endo-1,4-beta-xylanase